MMGDEQEIKVILQIGMNKDNNVTVSGPIGNKGMCVDLLAHAILIINGMKEEPKSKIIRPGMLPGMPH